MHYLSRGGGVAIFLIASLVTGCDAGALPPDSNLQAAEPLDHASVIREVRARFDGLADAARSLDTDVYLSFFDRTTFSSLNADGSVFGSLEPFADTYGASLEQVERYLDLDFGEVHVQPITRDVAILVNEYVASVQLKNGEVVQAAGGGTQVWSKVRGEWLLVNVSSSSAD